jgi:hypothetical protein
VKKHSLVRSSDFFLEEVQKKFCFIEPAHIK